MSVQTNYHTNLTIGLVGFGVVGEAIFNVLQNTPSLQATVAKICIKHPNKTRSIAAHYFTTDVNELLDNEAINVIIEVIDDSDAAYQITRTSLQRGKAVITANKKMLAEHLPELIDLQQRHQVPLLYEAASCASIPVIRNLEEYYDNDLLQSVRGIINGSTNFILTQIFENKLTYTNALKLAQERGFAESNPALDVKGRDAANKLCILLTHAYGILASPDELLYHGIEHIHAQDATLAAERGWQIKLVAQAVKLSSGDIAAFVLPQFVETSDLLHNVRNEFNGLTLASSLADAQFFYGKGAGGFPTASAILSDLSALRYNYKYEYKKLLLQKPLKITNELYVRIYVSASNWDNLPIEEFAEIDEWYANNERNYVVGVYAFSKLQRATWWKNADVSLILTANGIAEDYTPRRAPVRQVAFTATYDGALYD